MKKYDLSKIMKRAWDLVKKAGMTISSGLKKAWEEAKNMCKDSGGKEVFRAKEENFEDLLKFKKSWKGGGCLSVKHDYSTGEYVLVHTRKSWASCIMESTANMAPHMKDLVSYLDRGGA